MKPLRKFWQWLKEQFVNPESLHRICILIEKLKTGAAMILKDKQEEKVLRLLNQALLFLELTHHHNPTYAAMEVHSFLKIMKRDRQNELYKQIGGLMLSYETGLDVGIAEEKVKEFYDSNKAQIVLEAGV